MSGMTAQGRDRKLYRFHGGLHLPDNKAQSLQAPVEPAGLPARLYLPLQQHIGAIAKAVVAVGDRVLKGQVVAAAAGAVSAPVHAPTSGSVVEIGDYPVPHPSGLAAPCIVIEPDGKEEWGELPEPLADFTAAAPDELRQRIRDAGIVGLGGAAFPTAVKLAANRQQRVETLVINGAECEPYITCDDLLMRNRADRVAAGIAILKHILDAPRCLVGIEDNKPKAIEAMTAAVAARGLGNTEVVTIPTLYPSGGEKQLIRILTGKEVPSGGIPAHMGIVCQNVGTTAAVADAVELGRPLISRYVTVTGEGVRKPRNLEVLVGTPAAHLVERAGGYSGAQSRLIVGGPMMGFTLDSDAAPVTKAVNCLLVASEAEAPTPPPATPCIRCGRCAEVCPARLLPQQMYWHARAKDLAKARSYHLFDCIECGCCSHVCPADIPLVQYFRFAKMESWAQEREQKKAELARQRHEARVERQARQEAERQALLKQKKEALARKKRAAARGEGETDPKKAAIAAAMKRAQEKKAKLSAEGKAPRNTDRLTEAQKRQIEAAEQRRKAAADPPAGGEGAETPDGDVKE